MQKSLKKNILIPYCLSGCLAVTTLVLGVVDVSQKSKFNVELKNLNSQIQRTKSEMSADAKTIGDDNSIITAFRNGSTYRTLQNKIVAQSNTVSNLNGKVQSQASSISSLDSKISSLQSTIEGLQSQSASSQPNSSQSNSSNSGSATVQQSLGVQFSNWNWDASQDALSCTITNTSNQVQDLYASNFVLKIPGQNAISSQAVGGGTDGGFEDSAGVYDLSSAELMPGDVVKWYEVFDNVNNNSVSGYTLYYVDGSTPLTITTFN